MLGFVLVVGGDLEGFSYDGEDFPGVGGFSIDGDGVRVIGGA